jgi:hypothetical protein
MRPTTHWCACPCHGNVTHHCEPRCSCGGRLVDPSCRPRCGPQDGPGETCPPPEREPQPGTFDLPQTPPPHFPTAADPPWHQDRPPAGSTGELPWFKAKVRGATLGGPRFGPRKDEFLPYLLLRVAPGDRGRRPYTGVFWESPDIYVDPDHDADSAPLLPPTLGGLARANRPNTLYAHVWNLGKAPAGRVRVEFYWFNPSLGISRADANLIGAAYVDLQNRFASEPRWRRVDGPSGPYASRGNHAVVRCPVTWVPQFVNEGHECLVVRAFEPFMDTVAYDAFSPAADRHVGQRNIAVVQAASPAEIDLDLDLGWPDRPSDVRVEVNREAAAAMPWLELMGGDVAQRRPPAEDGVVAGLVGPTTPGVALPAVHDLAFDCRGPLLHPRQQFRRGCERLHIGLHAAAAELEADQAQVVRVRMVDAGDTVGGYTVVLTAALPSH